MRWIYTLSAFIGRSPALAKPFLATSVYVYCISLLNDLPGQPDTFTFGLHRNQHATLLYTEGVKLGLFFGEA